MTTSTIVDLKIPVENFPLYYPGQKVKYYDASAKRKIIGLVIEVKSHSIVRIRNWSKYSLSKMWENLTKEQREETELSFQREILDDWQYEIVGEYGDPQRSNKCTITDLDEAAIIEVVLE